MYTKEDLPLLKESLETYEKIYKNTYENDSSLTTVNELKVQKHLQHLYRHLMQNGFIRNLDTVDKNHLFIHADSVLEKIRSGDETWQPQVPPAVVNIINERSLFRQDE